ncbi:hypothetical protein B0O99DRAFT_697602 [Bisporella sp. PMI_857]|nr:hypothetical protein B0O99DRAFT_697602 [Bisporella sp. PMI_857]
MSRTKARKLASMKRRGVDCSKAFTPKRKIELEETEERKESRTGWLQMVFMKLIEWVKGGILWLLQILRGSWHLLLIFSLPRVGSGIVVASIPETPTHQGLTETISVRCAAISDKEEREKQHKKKSKTEDENHGANTFPSQGGLTKENLAKHQKMLTEKNKANKAPNTKRQAEQQQIVVNGEPEAAQDAKEEWKIVVKKKGTQQDRSNALAVSESTLCHFLEPATIKIGGGKVRTARSNQRGHSRHASPLTKYPGQGPKQAIPSPTTEQRTAQNTSYTSYTNVSPLKETIWVYATLQQPDEEVGDLEEVDDLESSRDAKLADHLDESDGSRESELESSNEPTKCSDDSYTHVAESQVLQDDKNNAEPTEDNYQHLLEYQALLNTKDPSQLNIPDDGLEHTVVSTDEESVDINDKISERQHISSSVTSVHDEDGLPEDVPYKEDEGATDDAPKSKEVIDIMPVPEISIEDEDIEDKEGIALEPPKPEEPTDNSEVISKLSEPHISQEVAVPEAKVIDVWKPRPRKPGEFYWSDEVEDEPSAFEMV